MMRHGKVESFFGTESRDQYCCWQQLGFNGTLVNKQKEKNRIVAEPSILPWFLLIGVQPRVTGYFIAEWKEAKLEIIYRNNIHLQIKQ